MITHDRCAAFEAKINILEKKLKEATDLIKFYADPGNYSSTAHVRPRVKVEQRLLTFKDCEEIEDHVLPVGGKRARQFLSKVELEQMMITVKAR